MGSLIVEAALAELLRQFVAHQDSQRAEGVRAYFKEPFQTYGLPVPKVRILAKGVLEQLKNRATLADILELSERLLRTDRLEEGLAVETFMGPFLKQLTPDHFPRLDAWVDAFSNWAVTDSVSTHVIGALIERHPELAPSLIPWTRSAHRWRRRAASVSLVVPIRRGVLAPREVFAITDNLMGDKDDMVQKGTGWALRELSVGHRDAVVEYLQEHPSAGRILVRYALEKMPAEQRSQFIRNRTRG